MEKTTQFSEAEIKAFNAVNELIDQAVLQKINSMPVGTADIVRIKKECEDQILPQIKTEMLNQLEVIKEFGKQFALDLPELCEKAKLFYANSLNKSENQDISNSNKLNPETYYTKEEIQIIYNTGRNWLEQNDYAKALLYFSFLAITNSKNADLFVLKGMVEQNLGKNEEALKSYAIALAIEPENINAQVNFMCCLLILNHADLARQAFDEFKTIDPALYVNNNDLKERVFIIEQQLNAA